MAKKKTPKTPTHTTVRGRVARRIKGYTGQVTDLSNQLTLVRDRLQMLETGETEPYLAALSKRQHALEEGLAQLTGKVMGKVGDQDAKIEAQNQTIGKLLDSIAALEKRLEKAAKESAAS